MEKKLKALKNALLEMYKVKQVKRSIEYKGPDLTDVEILCVSHNVKETLSGRHIKEDDERDMLDYILLKAYQFGYEACKERYNDPKSIHNIMQTFSKQLEELQKNKHSSQ